MFEEKAKAKAGIRRSISESRGESKQNYNLQLVHVTNLDSIS